MTTSSDLDQTAADLGMGGHLAPEGDDAGYRRRMEKRQQVQQQRVEERNKEKVEKGFKKECIQTHIPLKNRGAAVISYLYEAVWLRYIITVFVSSKVILRIPWWTQGEQCVF